MSNTTLSASAVYKVVIFSRIALRAGSHRHVTTGTFTGYNGVALTGILGLRISVAAQVTVLIVIATSATCLVGPCLGAIVGALVITYGTIFLIPHIGESMTGCAFRHRITTSGTSEVCIVGMSNTLRTLVASTLSTNTVAPNVFTLSAFLL